MVETVAVNAMMIERFFEMPRTMTFEMPKLRAWVLKWIPPGKCLNVFGGMTHLQKDGVLFHHNDLNPDVPSDTHFDARTVDENIHDSFDSAILDPPYSYYQAVHSYKGVLCQDITACRVAVDRLLKSGAITVSLGWNTTGFGMKRGYEKLGILIVNSGGSHNDILILVERKK